MEMRVKEGCTLIGSSPCGRICLFLLVAYKNIKHKLPMYSRIAKGKE